MNRPAYSLIEVLIALAILGLLMGVAWGLLGSFQETQQRAWRQTERIELGQQVRSRLHQDLLQSSGHQLRVAASNIAPQTASRRSPTPTAGRSSGTAMAASRFSGDENGFTLELTPRLSPVHYWTHLLSSPSESLLEAEPKLPGLPLRIEVAWRLEENGFGDFESYLLSREIRFLSEGDDEDPVESVGRDRRGGRRGLTEPSAMERATREPLRDESSTMGLRGELVNPFAASPEDSLETWEGVSKGRFRYHDGTGWRQQWSADPKASVPFAVELSILFQTREDRTAMQEEMENATAGETTENQLKDLNDSGQSPSDLPFLERSGALEDPEWEQKDLWIVVATGRFEKDRQTGPLGLTDGPSPGGAGEPSGEARSTTGQTNRPSSSRPNRLGRGLGSQSGGSP
ncbi:MAG: prepilin-type N-terminal cleavage/methylation domain-containing protein [Pirellulaceae bacterium]